MWELLVAYWPHILAALSVTMATAAIVHVVMTKDDVRAATGWVGVVLLSPVLGALIYAVAGINRIRRASPVDTACDADGATRRALRQSPVCSIAPIQGQCRMRLLIAPGKLLKSRASRRHHARQ